MSGWSVVFGLTQALIGAVATLAICVSAHAQIPAQPVDPDAPWMTREEAVLLRERALEAALARGELERRSGGGVRPTERATPETLFRLYGRYYPGAPRWYEPEAVEVFLADLRRLRSAAPPDFALSRDGSAIAVPRLDFPSNELWFIDLSENDGWRLRPELETIEFVSVAFSPAEDMMAVAVSPLPGFVLGEIWVLDYQARLIERFQFPNRAPFGLDFSLDGGSLVFFLTDAVWDEAPEYAPRGRSPASQLVECRLVDGACSAVSDARLGGRYLSSIYAPDGRSVLVPETDALSFRGRVDLGAGQAFSSAYGDLGVDAEAFMPASPAQVSMAGLRFDLDRPPGRVIEAFYGPPPLHADTRLIDRAEDGLLILHYDSRTRSRAASLAISGPERTQVVLSRSGERAGLGGERDALATAQISENGCVLAHYAGNRLPNPVIELTPLCRNTSSQTIRLAEAAAALPLLQAVWSMRND